MNFDKMDASYSSETSVSTKQIPKDYRHINISNKDLLKNFHYYTFAII